MSLLHQALQITQPGFQSQSLYGENLMYQPPAWRTVRATSSRDPRGSLGDLWEISGLPGEPGREGLLAQSESPAATGAALPTSGWPESWQLWDS